MAREIRRGRPAPWQANPLMSAWPGISHVCSSGRFRAGRLLFVINDLDFLISHRLPVMLAAVEAGYEVHIAAPMDIASERELAGSGFHLHRLGTHRHKTNPVAELRSFWEIYALSAG